MDKAAFFQHKVHLLVIIDLVDSTKGVVANEAKARENSTLLKNIAQQAVPFGFIHISKPGDACVLLGETPMAPGPVLALAEDLFVTNPPDQQIRIVAQHGGIRLETEGDKVTDYLGKNVTELYRLEKEAGPWQLLITDSLYRIIDEEIPNDTRTLGPRTKSFKGMEAIRAVYWLLEFPRQVIPSTYPEMYTDRRTELWEQVQNIPVFGGLYGDVPMEQNFLNLSLGRIGQKGVADRPVHSFTARDHDEEREEHRNRDIYAKDIIEYFPKGMILGLPGAGKTTMLNHIAFSLLKHNQNLSIILLRCRDLTKSNARFCGIENQDENKALHFLVGSFLFPQKTLCKLGEKNQKIWVDTLTQFQEAWKQGSAVVMIDALDETPDQELREWILHQYEILSKAIPDQETTACSRLYLTSRPAAVHEEEIDFLPGFWVNPLHFGHLQDMARFFLGADDPVAQKFNQEIAKAPYAAKVGGTPLTALLILTWYRVYGFFEMRYATYDLIVKFILLRTWDLVKSKEIQNHSGIARYFKTVKDKHFLEKHQAVALLYRAFTDLAFATLYRHKNKDKQTRTFTEESFLVCLEARASVLGVQGDRKEIAEKWFDDLVEQHLIVSAGTKRYQFIHQTVMEYLAARHLLNHPSLWDEAIESEGDLDTWPIACSRHVDTAYQVLGFLASVTWPEDNVLPLRCLAETEAVERHEIDSLDFEHLIEKRQSHFKIAGGAPKTWIYKRISELFALKDTEKINEWRQRVEPLPGLNREKLLERLPDDWDQNLTLVTHRKALLEALTVTSKWVGRQQFTKAEKSKIRLAPLYLERYRSEIGSSFQQIYGIPRLGHLNSVNCVAINPTAKIIATGSYAEIRLWDLSTGFCIGILEGHTGEVTACSWTPDGSILASASNDRTLRLWDLDGTTRAVLEGHEDWVRACAWAPDGSVLASASL